MVKRDITVSSFILLVAFPGAMSLLAGDRAPTEDDYYRMIDFPVPEGSVFEVGGMDWLDDEKTRLLVCTRHSEMWILDNPYAEAPVLAEDIERDRGDRGDDRDTDADGGPAPENVVRYTRFAFGLHEPLGLVVNPGRGFPDGIFTVQRSELTRIVDTDGDDRADVFDTFSAGWEISGSYHEYAFGPKMGGDRMLWVTLNRPFGGGQEGKADWRGWAVKIDPEGRMHPVCPGLRSPAGLGANAEGDMFFTDNQGDHVAAGKLGHLREGVFHGNPVGLDMAGHPLASFELPFQGYPKKDIPWAEAVEANPKLVAPAIWFPYPRMGRSQTDVLWDSTGGKFGPFEEQLFVGDLSNAIVVRVFLEKVGGEYQGACFPFRRGFTPPVLRMCWGRDGSMFAGGSSRGWGGGKKPYGLARLVWTGKTPFEIHEVRALPDGFELAFTKPFDADTAADPSSYAVRTWHYNYSGAYGDKPRDEHPLEVKRAAAGADARSARLVIDGLEPGYVVEVRAAGVRSREGLPLLHPEAYYTLNRMPR